MAFSLIACGFIIALLLIFVFGTCLASRDISRSELELCHTSLHGRKGKFCKEMSFGFNVFFVTVVFNILNKSPGTVPMNDEI